MNKATETVIRVIFVVIIISSFVTSIVITFTKKEPTQEQFCQPKPGQRAVIDNIDGKLSCTIHQDPKSSHYTFNKKRTT